jgi:hypothetical protein
MGIPIQKGTQRAALFQAFVGRNLLGSFVAINKKVEASYVHGLDDISQLLWSLWRGLGSGSHCELALERGACSGCIRGARGEERPAES